MPNASAPNAPCVEVWESPHTITSPGCVSPICGPMTCTIPCPSEPIGNSVTPNSCAVGRQGLHLALARSRPHGPGGGRHVVVHRGDGEVGPPDGAPRQPQPLEGLGLVTSWTRCRST